MIKLNDSFSFKVDHHGYRLTQTYDTVNPKTKEPCKATVDTFHANLQQLAEKIVFLSGENVSGNLDDLKAAWFTCVADIRKALKEKVND